MRWSAALMFASPLRAPLQARLDVGLSVLLVLAGLALLGPGLGHPSIHNWDESAHQAATRGAYETPLRPHIFDHQVYPQPPKEWMSSGVFLHKPTGPFWFGALLMHLIGITPLALRLGSLAGELAAALAIYWLSRRAAGHALSFAGGLAWLALPFAYELTEGYFFGDATDCTLAGWVATAIVLLLVSVERQDPRLATAAGAATGLGYLCKSALALVPLGVAAALVVLAWRKWSAGLPLRSFVFFAGALLVVAVPWNAYCAHAFPVEYQYEARHTMAHLFTNEVGQWVRPPDAILNEINETELRPIPICLPFLALLWGIFRAVRRREPTVIAVTLWVIATWTVLGIAWTKVPATIWGAAPGAMVLLVLLFSDALEIPALAGAVIGGVITPRVLEAAPSLGRLPKMLPAALAETRTHPVLLIGVLVAAVGAMLAVGAQKALLRILNAERQVSILKGARVVAIVAVFIGLYPFQTARAAVRTTESRDAATAPMRELGLAIGQALPPGDALLFSQIDRDPPCCFLLQDLSFWSGKTNDRSEPNLERAKQLGLHPYLVSVAAEPYAPVPGIPAYAAGRLYDLEQPAALAPLPADVTPLDARGPNWHLLGWSSGYRDAEHDVWSLYLEGGSPTFSVTLVFETPSGPQQVSASPNDTYSDPRHWRSQPWVEVSVVGPHRSDASHLHLGATTVF